MSTTFRIIDKLGGQNDVLAELNAVSGHKMHNGELVKDTVGYRAIRNWHNEGKIPPARQLQLIQIATKHGIDWSMDDFELEKEKVPA